MTIDAWMVSPEDGRGCRAVLPYRGRIRFPMSGKPERAEAVAIGPNPIVNIIATQCLLVHAQLAKGLFPKTRLFHPAPL